MTLNLCVRSILNGLGILFLCLLQACTCEAPRRLRLGMMRGAACSPLALAVQKKIFADARLHVELQIFSSFAEAQKAHQEKKLDLMCSNLAELILLNASPNPSSPPKGGTPMIDYKILFIPAASHGADVLVARKDAGTQLQDLKGARIGVPPASMGDLLLDRVLTEHTLVREDFTVLSLDAADLREALAKSEIQLAVSAPPYSLAIMQSSDMEVLYRSSSMPGELLHTLAARENFLQTAPDLLTKIESVWQQSLQFIQDHPEQAWSELAKAATLPVATLQEDYKFFTAAEQADYWLESGRAWPLIERLQSHLIESGSIKTARDPHVYLYRPTQK